MAPSQALAQGALRSSPNRAPSQALAQGALREPWSPPNGVPDELPHGALLVEPSQDGALPTEPSSQSPPN